MPLIQANQLTRYYGAHCAVDHISFTLDRGDILGFLGPNGAGKSTTMQMLTGTLAPSEGEILIDGIDLLDHPRQAKSVLGYLPEQPPLYKDMTVQEYLRYCARLHRIPRHQLADAVELASRRCGLLDVGRRLIGNLSKGYQQRVGIAQAIVHSPQVIILDEPTVGLDPIQIREIRELIVELGSDHGIILSTHILPEVQAVCNRVQIINHGQLVFESSMQDLLQQNHDRFVVAFGNPVELAQLQSLPCVREAETGNDGFVIRLHADANVDMFVEQAVAEGWRLRKLVPQQASLEQIFVRLAHHSDPVMENDATGVRAA